jgi:PAS domain-containing protein
MTESSLDSLVAISPDGRITDVNEATVKVTGMLHEELFGTAFSRDAGGNVLGAFAAARHVTKHMQAREREQLIELHQFQRSTGPDQIRNREAP